MSLDPKVMDDFRDYLGVYPVQVNEDDAQSEVKRKIEEVNADEAGGSPAGRGRLVQLPSARLRTQELLLPQGQSLHGVKGSTILMLDGGATLTDRGGGVAAYITIDNDFRVLDGIAGQGVIADLDIEAAETNSATGPSIIHGLYAPDRGVADANLHTIRNVGVYNAKDNGIHFDAGNDKLVCDRLRSEGAKGIGIYLAGGDVKARAVGSVSSGSALKIQSAAIELDQFDLWRPAVSNPEPTLDIIGGSNGCVIKSGTVEGRSVFTGKNGSDNTLDSPRFINCRAQFAFVHFKHDSNQISDCYLESKSADLLEIISCKFGRSGPDKLGDGFIPYDYLIKITRESGDTSSDSYGLVKISGGSGMLRYLGRVGETIKTRMDCKKHFCNRPELVLFDWGRPGTIEVVPVWVVDSVDPKARTHIRMDGVARTKADYPFGYLCATIATNGRLDDGVENWTPSLLPDVSSSYCYAMRVLP